MPSPDTTPEPCQHGIKWPIICPQCDPEAYERARPQVERWLKKDSEGRQTMSNDATPDSFFSRWEKVIKNTPRHEPDDHGMKAMMKLSDADFLRGLKTRGQDYVAIVRIMNERIERIARSLEGDIHAK